MSNITMLLIFGRLLIVVLFVGCVAFACSKHRPKWQRVYFGVAAVLNAAGFFGVTVLSRFYPERVADAIGDPISISGLLLMVSYISWFLSMIGFLVAGVCWLIGVLRRSAEKT
ncbi:MULTISPECIES: hypothetical protein [Burkholderia]|uniref:hypothetical protein n=1 Tax=Burkholderia TaxID=32008 RepID=UPI00116087CD|nr:MULTISPECIES: hypothetical protein [Burkholderia]